MLKQIAFMWLIPTHMVRGYSAKIEPIHVRRGDQFLHQFRIVRDRSNYQTGPERFGNMILININDAGKRKKKFSIRERMRCVFTVNDRRKQI